MTIYLDEDQVGQDAVELAYPHLLLCMGLTIQMGDGSLIGAHFTTPHTEEDVASRMTELVSLLPSGIGMNKLYMTGNFEEHVDRWGGQDLAGKAALIGFHGDAYKFDTSVIKPKDGTFVLISSLGPDNVAQVEYKRDEKMNYTRQESDTSGGLRLHKRAGVFVVNHTTKSGKSLHLANHRKHLQHFVV